MRLCRAQNAERWCFLKTEVESDIVALQIKIGCEVYRIHFTENIRPRPDDPECSIWFERCSAQNYYACCPICLNDLCVKQKYNVKCYIGSRLYLLLVF